MNDNIDRLFERLRGSFDMEEPQSHHQQRFLERLGEAKKNKKSNRWTFFSVAASVAVLIGVGVFYRLQPAAMPLSPEIEQTQVYFTALLQEELEKVTAQESPDTKAVINDGLRQMEKLEKNYEQLKQDLLNNSNNPQLLHAMIVNFQTRIDLLEDILEQIESIKQLKNNTYETQRI